MNKNTHFTISFIYWRVYDRVVHVGRRFIVKMTTVCSIQLIHLFIDRGNCRQRRQRMLWHTSVSRKSIQNTAVSDTETQVSKEFRDELLKDETTCLWFYSCWLSDISPFYVSYFREEREQSSAENIRLLSTVLFPEVQKSQAFYISAQNMVWRRALVKFLKSP